MAPEVILAMDEGQYDGKVSTDLCSLDSFVFCQSSTVQVH